MWQRRTGWIVCVEPVSIQWNDWSLPMEASAAAVVSPELLGTALAEIEASTNPHLQTVYGLLCEFRLIGPRPAK